ncbi:MAG TPA: hypothetical protein VI385_04750 [Flavisolibacter sp.]
MPPTTHVSRLTFHVSQLTIQNSQFTIHISPYFGAQKKSSNRTLSIDLSTKEDYYQ